VNQTKRERERLREIKHRTSHYDRSVPATNGAEVRRLGYRSGLGLVGGRAYVITVSHLRQE
jgi:hypothetical protein